MILKVSVTEVEELKTKVWFVPRAGSFGQVALRGLQGVHVCANTIGVRAAAPTRSDKNLISKECGG